MHTFDTTGQPIGAESVAAAEDTWTPVVVTPPDNSAAIGYVCRHRSTGSASTTSASPPSPQPDTEITGGPVGHGAHGEAAFSFAGNQDRMTFACTLDAAAVRALRQPKTYSGLADGTHTFTVMTIDRWGAVDATPATRTWTVRRTPPPPDRDADGVVDATDNCPDNANPAQGDGDKDGVGDVCEQLPPGTAPIEAAQGDPAEARLGRGVRQAAARRVGRRVHRRAARPVPGRRLHPAQGRRHRPAGLHPRHPQGQVALTAAVNGQRSSNRRQLRREARFRAGIFQIRQARYRKRKNRKRSAKIRPRAQLVSAPGAERPCARRSGVRRGVPVRALAMTAKGVFRTVGGAATVTPRKGTATFITTDRCDGTVTEVGRGRVTVVAKKASKRTRKRRVVPAGRAYIVKARLFAARKGRRS